MESINWIKLICTVGPASLNQYTLKKMENLGVDLLRINMSHTSLEQMKKMIFAVRAVTSIPICIDTEGAQIRTGEMIGGKIEIRKGDLVKLTSKTVMGNSRCFSLTPAQVLNYFKPGMLIYVDYNRVLLLVRDNPKGKEVIAEAICGGIVGSNKAVNVDREIDLPSITEKDYQAIELAKKEGIDAFALSFTNRKEAVEDLRTVAGREAFIISKIETKQGIKNLDGIIQASDAILIDRGDLSREVSIEQVPTFQKVIISRAHKKPVPVYVATNLLESMVSIPYPTRAEVNDIANTLLDGANGLVLAAETAIGKYPVQCISMVRRLIQQHQEELERKISFNEKWLGAHLIEGGVPPHGFDKGKEIVSANSRGHLSKELPRLVVDILTIRNIVNIAYGCYSPLRGFMGRREIESVLDDYTLPCGVVWTMPIVLQTVRKNLSVSLGDRAALASSENGKVIAWIDISDIYQFDFDDTAIKWFGTTSIKHPGVQRLKEGGDCFVGGTITLVPDIEPFSFSEYFLSPPQVRAIFAHYSWNKVVAFHTRNIPHRAHEYIQKQALERSGADGLFIHPVLGCKKQGDFTSDVIMAGYKAFIDKNYPLDKVFLSGFFADSWYAGPREAVFTALCRKNYGCSHFIVGRDHTGAGDFYKPNDSRALFEKLGDLEIKPIFFDKIVYNNKLRDYCEIVPNDKLSNQIREISGSDVRKYILANKLPPKWMVRPEVSEAIFKVKAEGKDILVA